MAKQRRLKIALIGYGAISQMLFDVFKEKKPPIDIVGVLVPVANLHSQHALYLPSFGGLRFGASDLWGRKLFSLEGSPFIEAPVIAAESALGVLGVWVEDSTFRPYATFYGGDGMSTALGIEAVNEMPFEGKRASRTAIWKIGAFRGDAALSSWIYRITFNTAMSRLRTAQYQHTQKKEVSMTPDGDEAAAAPYDVADWTGLADEQVLRSELRHRLARAIQALPAIYRAPVLLRDIQGMSTEEASAVLRVKDQTLKSRLHRGRLILRAQLADFAGGLTLHHATA